MTMSASSESNCSNKVKMKKYDRTFLVRIVKYSFNHIIIILLLSFVTSVNCFNFKSDHSVDLDDNYRLMWQIKEQEIIFEIQVRTLGYVGLGFSRDGSLYGADVVIGWVDQGQAYFQDRHIKRHGDGEPVLDPQQNYILSLGYENATHTVLRFSRKLDTCDKSYDVPITNDTMNIMFVYHEDEPRRGLVVPGSLPKPSDAFKSIRPMFLLQRVIDSPIKIDGSNSVKMLELKNEDAELPDEDNSVYWCKMFKIADIQRKHHIIRYEPVFESATSVRYMNHIILYECQSSSPELEIKSREYGGRCDRAGLPMLSCNSVVAAWARGSKGFTFPDDVGYELDSNQARFYLMETHYSNLYSAYEDKAKSMVDNSGIRIYYTTKLREYDAGVLSVGMEPTWKHIIPPGQPKVVSEGHCVEECTRRGFQKPINIIAVMFRTHSIGRQVKLRQIRGREELLPIAEDKNTVFNYQDYRRLSSPVKSLPGDRLITECIYDSTTRPAITLGGPTLREETCTAYAMYYPRQKDLTSCHSSPSLPTVLHSLGIEELDKGSNPVSIASPPELAGMTLERRLVTYDWKKHFNMFQTATLRGSFRAQCWTAKNTPVPGTENIDGYAPNVTKIWKQQRTCSFREMSGGIPIPKNRVYATETDINIVDGITITEADENNIIEGAARSKVSRSSATSESLGLSGTSPFSSTLSLSKSYSLVLVLCLLFCNSFRISLLHT